MKTSELFVKCLEAEGVTRIFGLPGEENADFVMALEGSPIELLLVRHEQGAAFMAEVHGRLTGECGVCLGTLGPGATNLITGVADANMDRAPLICLTGQADSKRQHKESHQAMDVVRMFESVTKWAQAIIHPDNVPEVLRKAFKLATMEKPGACHIELAEDIAKLDARTTPLVPQRQRRPVADEKIVDEAFGAIRSSRRPIILAGNGTIRRRASAQLRQFARATGIGVVSTFMAKGCIDMDDEACLYTIGLQSRDHITCALDASDLVICVGYDMVEYHPRLWNAKNRHRILHLDFLPAEIDSSYAAEVEVVGDLAHTLWMLNERVAAMRDEVDFDLGPQRKARAAMLADLEEHAGDDTQGLIRPQKALADARSVLGPSDILLSDVGAHKMWVARHYHCHEPNTCLIPNGFCSMGFALPGAIAAALVHPERRVLAVCGDGGFLMNVQEMETATRLGVGIVAMVWEDRAYGLIEWKQENEFGRHADLSFENPDWMQLARAFRWNGHHVQNSRDLAPTLERAFQEDGPSLVVIPIDYRENKRLTQRLGDIVCPI